MPTGFLLLGIVGSLILLAIIVITLCITIFVLFLKKRRFPCKNAAHISNRGQPSSIIIP